jgi:hypothetical protein
MKDEYSDIEVWNIVAGALDKPIGELERLGWDGQVYEDRGDDGTLKSYYIEIAKSADGGLYDTHRFPPGLFADKR